MMTTFPTRFNKKWILYTIVGLVAAPLLSLFLLQVFAALLFLMFVFDKYGSKAKSMDIFAYLLGAFAVLRIVSILLSEYPHSSYMAIPKEALFYASFVALMYYLKVLEKKDWHKIIDYAIWAGVLVAVIGIVLFASGKVDRAQAFGSGYSTFSTYLLVILAFRLAGKPGKDLKDMLIWSVQAGIILSGIILSMGRTNMLIAFMLFAIMAVASRINYKPILITAGITLLLVFGAFQLNSNELDKRVERPLALSDRDILYEGIGMVYKDHPFFGFGPRTFHDVFPLKDKLVDKGIGSWHNEYIQTYLEAGAASLIVLLLVFFTFFIRLKRLIFSKIFPENKGAIVYSTAGGITVLMLAGVTGAFLYSPILSIIFGFLLSLFSAVYYNFAQGEYHN